jgi:hypothetical protein
MEPASVEVSMARRFIARILPVRATGVACGRRSAAPKRNRNPLVALPHARQI